MALGQGALPFHLLLQPAGKGACVIPIRDTIPSRRFPVVNTALIILNGLVFLFEASLGPLALQSFINQLGLVPARFWAFGGLWRWLFIFTAMFLHGGWWHLISNMLALYIFGDNVEDRMGPGRYLIFYLLCGFAAGMAHLFVYPSSPLPTVGASGAIAGVLGAYLLLFPHSRVITLIPIFFFFEIIEIPAFFYLGFWFFAQLFNGLFTLAARVFQSGGVAWWAHVGGFVAGMALVPIFRRPPPRVYVDEYWPW